MSIEEHVDGLQLAAITLEEAPLESGGAGLDQLIIQEQAAKGIGEVFQLLAGAENTLAAFADQAYDIHEKGDAGAKLICDVAGSSDQERMPSSLVEALAGAEAVSKNGEQFADLLHDMGDKLDIINRLLRQVGGHLLEYHDLSGKASKALEDTMDGRHTAITALQRYITARTRHSSDP